MSEMGVLGAVQWTKTNLADVAAWLPSGITCSTYVDLLIVNVPLLGAGDNGLPGEVKPNEWLVLQPDGNLRVVSNDSFKRTWRRRLHR